VKNTPAGGGPHFEDLAVGDVYASSPALTLTDGTAAAHRAIVGDRMRLPLDAALSTQVTGRSAQFAHPALVWNIAIGQSTGVTHHVVANLFYRGLVFHRYPAIGDTLHTRTEVVGLRQNSRRPDRPATGLAALRVTTTDQHGRAVLDFVRCAMLPLRDGEIDTGHRDDLDALSDLTLGPGRPGLGQATSDWNLAAFPRTAKTSLPLEGFNAAVDGGDIVSSAPELARLTLNVATVHHDAASGSKGRLVYGGHTIALALAQATRVFPDLITVTQWHGCDHTGPVREGDTLYSEVEVESAEPHSDGAQLVELRSHVWARPAPDDKPRHVLDWRYTALMPL
jgi:acyl dehydratase